MSSTMRPSTVAARGCLRTTDTRAVQVRRHEARLPAVSALHVLVQQAPRLLACALASTVVALSMSSAALAEPVPEPALFTRSCAGCHGGGGNVVQANASLSTEDMKRNGINDADAIYDILYKGKGKMPGYGKDCAPRGACTFGARLSDDDLHSLTDYVLERAAADWK